MRKLFTSVLFTCILATSFAQGNKKVSTFLLAQYNHTLYDETKGNNPWGIGLGLQSMLNNKTMFKPAVELTADIYLEDDKTLTIINGTAPATVRGMVNLFGGTYFVTANNFFISFTAGPSLIGGKVFLGIKPAAGVFFSKNKRWTGKLCYINIFNREQITKHDFGSISVALGIKLF